MTTQALFREDAYLTQCDAVVLNVGDDGIRLDRTVFYPLGGGRAGDTGTLTLPDGSTIAIADTRKAGSTAQPPTTPCTCPHRGRRRVSRRSSPACAWSLKSTGCAAIATCGCMPRRT